MKIIEQSITAKSRTAEAEDGIAITDDFIAVIDGSTSKSSVRISQDISNGRYCMLLIKEFMETVVADIAMEEFCRDVTSFIRSRYDNDMMQRLASHPEERMTASCIVYSRKRNEIWMVGDCQCIAGDTLYENPKPYEAELARRRADIIKTLLESGERSVDDIRRDDEGRKAIIPDMVKTMQNQNKTYAVVDGFDIPMQKVKFIPLDDKCRQIILASDGYPFLHDTLEESEAALRKQLESDPLNIGRFKATKAYIAGNNSFDDRSYIRFTI